MLDKFIRWLLNRAPVCPRCNGIGFHISLEHLDSMTTRDVMTSCEFCDQYGVYPLPFLFKVAQKIGLVKQ